ncbi:unnamed protein product [Rhizoctonia solani]|nr:unnamed protein product [Rhizoctonia solani]
MDVGPYETIDFGKLADAFPPLKPLLNYVLWISELVKVLNLEEPIIGLDIGTGSTAIYPLLACSIHKTWGFIAADIDPRSLAASQANIEQNPGVKDRIRLYTTTQEAPILSPLLPENLAQLGIHHVAFSMCNPPFYSDVDEVNRSAENKEYDPHAVCTGALVEMITPGGEVAFVQRMIDENGTQVYSIDNYAITELVQGTTRRWVVAWSFTDTRLPDTLARPKSSSLKSIAPLPNNLHHPTAQPISHESLVQALKDVPQLQFHELLGPPRIHATVYKVTWTRAARRRMAREEQVPNEDVKPVMVCEVRLVDAHALEVRWVRGRDRTIFESFWGYLSKRLDTSVL